MTAIKARNKPQSSLTGRMSILALKLAVIPVIAFVLFYAVMTAWWYSGDVIIERDVVGELVARSAAASSPTPAWPGVAEAFRKVDPNNHAIKRDLVHPDCPEWANWMEFAEQQSDGIIKLRESLDHQSLGFLASVVHSDGDGWLYDAPDFGPIPMKTGLDLVTPVAALAGDARSILFLLLIHAWQSIENNEHDEAVDDLVAAIIFAEQSRETSFLISDFVSISSHAMAINGTLALLEAHPDQFTADDLRMLRGANDAFMGGDILFGLDDESLLQRDFAQRMFTDNGSGDGHAVVFFPKFEMFSENEFGSGRERSLVGPVWLAIAPSRKEYEAMSKRCVDAIRADMLAPPWQYQQSEVELLKDELGSDWQSNNRWSLHLMLLGGGFFSFDEVIDRARTKQATASAVFAMHEYRADTGDWPPSLAALIPSYINRIPQDPFTGNPILAVSDPATGELTLYSAGRDGDDDLGIAADYADESWSPSPIDGDIIIWPMVPPTPESFGY